MCSVHYIFKEPLRCIYLKYKPKNAQSLLIFWKMWKIKINSLKPTDKEKGERQVQKMMGRLKLGGVEVWVWTKMHLSFPQKVSFYSLHLSMWDAFRMCRDQWLIIFISATYPGSTCVTLETPTSEFSHLTARWISAGVHLWWDFYMTFPPLCVMLGIDVNICASFL